jgi:hypothetical protein
LAISSMPNRMCSKSLTASSGGGCKPFCASRTDGRRWDAARPTTNDGPMPSSRNRGCSPFLQPMKTRDTPRDTPDEETSDWRAVCGRTARTVRRAGRKRPDPYRGGTAEESKSTPAGIKRNASVSRLDAGPATDFRRRPKGQSKHRRLLRCRVRHARMPTVNSAGCDPARGTGHPPPTPSSPRTMRTSKPDRSAS